MSPPPFPREFAWDAAKEARNLEKHGISFVAGAQGLASGSTFEFQSDRANEPRCVAVGTHPATKNVIAVLYTMRRDVTGSSRYGGQEE